MELIQLLNAREAIIKIVDSNDLPVGYAWDLADFIIEADKMFNQFDDLRKKIVSKCTEEVDGKQKLNEEKYTEEMEKLFYKEIELDVSILDIDTLKNVKELKVRDVLALKELME